MFTFFERLKKPKGANLPKDLGFDWPETKYLYVDMDCGSTDEHRVIAATSFAHAHICKHDALFGCICFKRSKYLWQDGKPHYIAQHERGHILTHYDDECVMNPETGIHTLYDPGSITGHGDKWRATMKRLGEPAFEYVHIREDGTFHIEDQIDFNWNPKFDLREHLVKEIGKLPQPTLGLVGGVNRKAVIDLIRKEQRDPSRET